MSDECARGGEHEYGPGDVRTRKLDRTIPQVVEESTCRKCGTVTKSDPTKT